MAVDIKSLTLGEMKFFEQTTGLSFTQFGQEGQPISEAMAVLVYLFKRRHDPNFTLIDAENFTSEQATEFLDLSGEPDEESPEGKEEGSLKKPRARKQAS